MLFDILLSPALLLGLVVALICASLFHLWQGRSLRDLWSFSVAAVLGFAVGQLVGLVTPLQWLVVGQLHLLEGVVFAVLGLVVANRLKV